MPEMQIEDPIDTNNAAAGTGEMETELKLCPTCTYGNEPGAEKCEMCESPLY